MHRFISTCIFNMYVLVRTGVAEIWHPILLSQWRIQLQFLSWFVSRKFLLQIFKVGTSLIVNYNICVD